MEEKIQADVANVAEKLKRLFAEAKTEKEGRRYNPHARFKKPEIWRAAAEKCIGIGADPYSFVRAAFLYCTVPGGPFPQNMCTAAATRWYHEYQKSICGDHPEGDVYQAEIKGLISQSLVQGMQSGRRLRDFLLDDSFPPLDSVPAFVRVVLLPRDEMVFQKFGKMAYQEVMGNQRLLDVLRNLGHSLDFVERVKATRQ